MTEWEFFKIKELADLLQLNQQTVRNWVNAGKLEYVQIGRAKYIPRRAAVALVGETGLDMPELLTVAQVARLLRLNPQTIRNWIDAGTFPAIYIGRRVRIKRKDLDAFIAANSSRPASDFWETADGRTGGRDWDDDGRTVTVAPPEAAPDQRSLKRLT